MERSSKQKGSADRIADDSVVIVTTGDELLCGQIVNTNAAQISALLHENKYLVARHLTIADDINTISQTLQDLIPQHKVIITTGGLGPTRDDITRDSIAAATSVPLELDEANWQHIQNLIKSYGHEVSPANKQQAYFPLGSKIITNDNGSASGCITPTTHGHIIMLPGPPHECMPMLKQILPKLSEFITPQKVFFKNWLLHNASESQVADKLNILNYEAQGVQIGYRAAYPYLEIKCWHADEKLHAKAIADIDTTIKDLALPYQNAASEIIYAKLCTGEISLYIEDHATGGRLETLLHDKQTNGHINFHDKNNAKLAYKITGLDDYWQESDAAYCNMQVTNLHTDKNTNLKIRNRSDRTPEYAAEQFCIYLLSQ